MTAQSRPPNGYVTAQSEDYAAFIERMERRAERWSQESGHDVRDFLPLSTTPEEYRQMRSTQ